MKWGINVFGLTWIFELNNHALRDNWRRRLREQYLIKINRFSRISSSGSALRYLSLCSAKKICSVANIKRYPDHYRSIWRNPQVSWIPHSILWNTYRMKSRPISRSGPGFRVLVFHFQSQHSVTVVQNRLIFAHFPPIWILFNKMKPAILKKSVKGNKIRFFKLLNIPFDQLGRSGKAMIFEMKN